jgi:hypothetical protein
MSIARKLQRIVVYDASTDPVEARYIWTGDPHGVGFLLHRITDGQSSPVIIINFNRVYYQPWQAKIWVGEISGEEAAYLNSIPTEKLPPNLYRIPAPDSTPST